MKSLLVVLAFSFVSSFANAEAPLARFGNPTPKLSYLPFNFKILDWNVYKGGKDGLGKDFAFLSRDTDVALLQESYETPQLLSDLTTANQELSWTMVRGFKYQGYFTGVATGSRVAAMKLEGFLTTVHEPFLNSPKTMMLSVYPLANSLNSLAVLNVHGINFVLNAKYKKQVQQIVSILKNHVGPILVAGDFNTWNDGRMKYLDNTLKTIGLVRLKLQNEEESSLDHAYVRGLQATEAELVSGIKSSDHAPMILQFQSPKEKAPALAEAVQSESSTMY